MLLSKAFLQECIANGTRKWNVDNAACMHMADFRVCDAKLATSKTV